jgi:hypothetical protein
MDASKIAARERTRIASAIAKMLGQIYLFEKNGILDGFEAHRLRICQAKLREVPRKSH